MPHNEKETETENKLEKHSERSDLHQAAHFSTFWHRHSKR